MPEDLSAAQVMERIEGTAERMGVLIDDLLLLARLDQHRTLSREPVDVLAVASDVVREFALISDGHRLDVVADGTEPAIVVGDPDRLRQVVSNLVANAIRHTPTGTCVTVSVNVVADDVLLEVSDDGPGMGEESAARAFERFYRADSARSREGDVSGSGLGLAIVQAIVQAHGGRATIRSELQPRDCRVGPLAETRSLSTSCCQEPPRFVPCTQGSAHPSTLSRKGMTMSDEMNENAHPRPVTRQEDGARRTGNSAPRGSDGACGWDSRSGRRRGWARRQPVRRPRRSGPRRHARWSGADAWRSVG